MTKRKALLPILLVCCLLVIAGCTATPTLPPVVTTAVVEPSIPPTDVPQPNAEPTAAPTAEPTAAETATEPAAGPVVLTIKGLDKELALTMADLKALPVTKGQAGMKSSTGKITVPAEYTGVLLTDLVEQVGGISDELGVNIVANDGYAMTLSYDQVTNGSFITYDPSDGSEKKINDRLQAMVAYAVNGQPLDERSEGILRMVIISPKNNQVTDGHWSVKWTERVEVMPLGREWTLQMTGPHSEVIDRNTFQSCAAASCHQSTWTDSDGQVWAGVPLYLLAGRMDDETTHDGPAYNRDLANAGYLIELVAADGYTTTVDSAAAYYNRNILVANMVDDAPLPDKYFPLRLVGDELEKGQRAGAIAEIRLLMKDSGVVMPAQNPAPTTALAETEAASIAETPAAPPEGTTLWITGKTANSLALNDAALHALQLVKLTAEHSKKGPTDYEGASLNALLDLAGVALDAKTLVLTASDGYSTSVDLAAVRACKDCLVAFTDEAGVYALVMPGFESSAWVKNIVKIEVK